MVDRTLKYKFQLGGCIRTLNIVQRIINYLEISNCYSDETNVGIKLIDDTNIINLILIAYNKSMLDFQVKFILILY